MPTTPIAPFTSTYVVLAVDNIDTDQIIPARFLKTTERTGLGASAFHDWRFRSDGTPIAEFPLNQASAATASILVTGRNFGCGSSREHAVWALVGAGFRAVVSTEFADIFRGNAIANGLLPIQVDAGVVLRLVTDGEKRPSVSVDLASRTLTLPGGETVQFPMAPFAQYCLLNGIDELDFLLGALPEIERFEAAHELAVRTHTIEEVAG